MSALNDHRIVDIVTTQIRTRYPRLIGKGAQTGEAGYGSEINSFELTTDQGARGWGISYHYSPQHAGCFFGKRVSDLFDPAVGATTDEAQLLDFPLHDLAGVILNQPVYRLLGGHGRHPVPCYASMIAMDDIPVPGMPGGVPVILDHCRAMHDRGFRAFKVKIGRGYQWMKPDEGLQRDVEVTRAVREQFPGCDILVDANNGYDCDGFLRYFDQVADCRLVWVEEPFREDRDDYVRLKERIKEISPQTLIASGEGHSRNIDLLWELAEHELLDVVQMDIGHFGLTRWREVIPRFLSYNTRIAPHCWGMRVKTHYAAHLAAGVEGTVSVEGVVDDTEGVELEHYVLKDGRLTIPELPGFGMRLIWGKPVQRVISQYH
jgi:L-alanine-DL-glutamate epimerase-like enolase superfamily enzyme